jgi:hypothetical protein
VRNTQPLSANLCLLVEIPVITEDMAAEYWRDNNRLHVGQRGNAHPYNTNTRVSGQCLGL